MPYLDPFHKIVNCSFGGFRLYYSPIYQFDTNGWGAPFYSGDPQVEVNPPFGTTLTQYADIDYSTRHKVATEEGVSEFAEQHTDASVVTLPGNCYWEDGSTVVSWWGNPGPGSASLPFPLPWTMYANNESGDGIQVGDVIAASESGVSHILIITGRKNSSIYPYTGVHANKMSNLTQYFYYDDLPDLSNCVWVNGTKYSVPVTSGSYGSIIMGACSKNGYIIYSEMGLSNDGSSDETIRWYKTEDGTSGTLTSYSVNNNYDSDQLGIWNCTRTYFNQACTKFITNAMEDYYTSFVRKVTGNITWTGSAPTGGNTSKTNKPYEPYYYGFDANDNEVWKDDTTSGSNYMRVVFTDLKYDFVVAYEISNYGTTYYTLRYILIQYNGWCRAYPVNATTEECDFSSYTTVSGGKIENWTGTQDLGFNEITVYASAGSCVVTEDRAFISLGNGINGQAASSSKSRVNYSIMIENDGTVTDLGTQLLNNTVSGNDFNSRLMTLQS